MAMVSYSSFLLFISYLPKSFSLVVGSSPSDYSNGLHTHADPSPQELWVRMDPLYHETPNRKK